MHVRSCESILTVPPRSSMDELDLNLKAAKQNERRNVINIKYK